MMPIKDILSIARAKGLENKEHIEKDYYIDLILYHLYKRDLKAIFKGGTALYKIYKIPRFSEDLDFTPLEELESIEKKIEDIAKELNFKVSKKRFGSSLFIKLSFKGFLTGQNRIKLEFNQHFKSLYHHTQSYISDYVDIPPFTIEVMDKGEILAEKIHAIFNRFSARDLYDLFYLLRMTAPNPELIQKKVPNYSYEKFKERVEQYNKIWDKEIKPFAIEYIPYEIVKNYVCEKLEGV